MNVEYDAGYVFISARQYKDRYVKIRCDTGFEPGTNLDGAGHAIPMEQLPMPLYEAIMSYVPAILDSQASKARDTERTEKIVLAEHYALQLLKTYVRWKGFSFRTMWRN